MPFGPRLMTLSEPGYRLRVPLDGVPPDTVPPSGVINVALHLRRKTLDEAMQPQAIMDELLRPLANGAAEGARDVRLPVATRAACARA